MNSASDLIARTRAGDDDAFHAIFERYSRPVISFIFDMVGERELSEESRVGAGLDRRDRARRIDQLLEEAAHLVAGFRLP